MKMIILGQVAVVLNSEPQKVLTGMHRKKMVMLVARWIAMTTTMMTRRVIRCLYSRVMPVVSLPSPFTQ